MLKRLTAAVLAVAIMLSVFSPVAYALDETEIQSEVTQSEQQSVITEAETVTETVVVDVDLPDNDEIFASYVDQQFYGNSTSILGTAGRERLSETEKAIYDLLKAKVEKLAENGGSTQLIVSDPETIGLKSSWTNTELGVESIVDLSMASSKFKSQYDIDKIIEALLYDCPYEMYWYDKTVGLSVSFSQVRESYRGIYTKYKVKDLTFTFIVEKEYQGENNTTVTNRVADVKTAVANANAIAEKYADKTDYEKLLGFKNEICSLVDYNYDALKPGTPYGNPWQMIYVFDGNEFTKVVCEGYSKAFQYLCDVAGVECYTTSGIMIGGTGAGNHMWNIVPIGDSNYMADITNSDAGSVGKNGQLFLAGTNGDVRKGYVFGIGNTNVTYVYDDDQIKFWGNDLLTLASENYNPVSKELASGKYGESIIWTVNDEDYNGKADTIIFSGSGEISDSVNPFPWDAYKKDIQQAIIQEGITSVTFNIFSGCTSLKNVVYFGSAQSWFNNFNSIILPENVEITFKGEQTVYVLDEKGTGYVLVYWGNAEGKIMVPGIYKGLPVTEIGESVFESRNDITEIVIPESVTIIGNNAFKNANKLEKITLPSTLVSIGENVFAGCRKLGTIVYNGNAQDWYDNCFDKEIPDNVYVDFTGDSIVFTKRIVNGEEVDEYILSAWPKASGKIVVPSTYKGLPVTEIGESVFDSNKDVTEIVIPENVTIISNNAFKNANKLEKITLPSTLVSISESAFTGCRKLETIVYNGNAQDWYDNYFYKKIPANAYVDFTGDSIAFTKRIVNGEEINEYILTAWTKASGNIVIPSTFRGLPVTRIKYNVFGKNNDIISVEISEGIKAIEPKAFEDCINLRTIKLPDSLREIGESAFKGCNSLEKVYYTSSYNWNKGVVRIYDGNKSILDADFEFETDWGYEYISGELCITGKENITENLVIPATVSGYKVDMIYSADNEPVFGNCEQIKTVTISQGIYGLELDAFNGCSNIEEIFIPASLIDFYGGYNNYFEGVPKTANIYVEKENTSAKALLKHFDFVNVVDYVPLEGIQTVDKITLFMNSDKDNVLPTVEKIPANASGKVEVVWSVAEGNLEIITDASGQQIVRANSYGKGKLVATDINSGMSTTVDVVTMLPHDSQPYAVLSNENGNVEGLKYGESAQIAFYDNTLGEIPLEHFTFSYNEEYVDIDENGVITSVYTGSEEKSIEVLSECIYATSKIPVKLKLYVSIRGIKAEDVSAILGTTLPLPEVTKVPATALETIDVKWTVAQGSDDIIEIIDENGTSVIKTKAVGIAQLIATDTNSGLTTIVNVTVKLPSKEKLTAVWDREIDKAGLPAGETRVMQISGNTVGALDAKHFDFKSSNENAVTVDENGMITVVFAGSGTANATITATVKGDTSKKVTLSVKAIPKQAEGIEIVAIYDNAEIKTVMAEDGTLTVIVPKSLVKDGTMPISLKAISKDANGDEIPTNVKWSTDASSIAKVTAEKGTTDSAVVTVGKNVDGLAVITATANDLKKTSATIEIDVRDYTPRLESNTITLNTYKVAGEETALYTAYDAILRDYDSQTAMLLASDTVITNVKLTGTGSELFTAVYDAGKGTVEFKGRDKVNNGTFKLNLEILTEYGETSQPVTIKVANKLPKVTIKQATAFELAYKDSTTDIVITATDPVNTKAEAVISTVTMSDSDSFTGTEYNSDTDSITLSYTDTENPLRTFANGKSADTKVNFEVEFEGYREKHIQKNYTIKTKETKIALGQTRSATKYTVLGDNNKPISVINSKTKETFDLTEFTVTPQSASADYVTVTKNGTELTITPKLNQNGKFTANNGTNHSTKIDVQHNNWLRPVTISHNISINTTRPTVKLKSTSLKLNSAFDEVTQTVLVPSLDNCPEFSWTITPQPSKSQTAEDFAKLKVDVYGWDVKAEFNGEPPAKGSYKYLLTTMIGDKETKLTLTVNVAETLPSVTLATTSAKLNSTINEDTAVKFKVPAGYEVTDAVITNGKGNLLTQADISVEYVNGEIAVKVVNKNLAKGNYKYDIVPVVKLAGEEHSKEVQLKKAVSLTVSVFSGVPTVTYTAKGKIDLVARDTGIVYTLTKGANFVYAASDVDTTKFALTGADADKFSITYLGTDAKGQHMIEVKAKRDAQLVKGGKYTYNISVKVDGIDVPVSMAKAVTVSPAQTSLKLAATGSTTIYQSNSGTARFVIQATTPVGAKIESVKLLDTNATTLPLDAVDVQIGEMANEDGSWTVSYKVKKPSKVKVNKSYKLAFEITPEGNSTNVKPQTFTVNLKVKR